MNKLILTLLTFYGIVFTDAQVKITDNLSEPVVVGTSSLLELESTDKALVISRVVDTSAITEPVNGMILYDMSDHKVKVYENGAWTIYLAPSINLDAAYDSGGNGAGSTVIADSGAVNIAGTDGLVVSGIYNQGAEIKNLMPGSYMFFNPRKAAFRAGAIINDRWDNNNVGSYSFASGFLTMASGAWSKAMGRATLATGENSTTMGNGTSAPSISETVVGQFNTTYTPIGGIETWNIADRLFTIGNGTSNANRSDAFIVYKNGNTTANGILRVSGAFDQGNLLQDVSVGSHMFFYPRKAAFRAGYVNGSNWHNQNIGNYSFATGYNTEASTENSIAMGNATRASGEFSSIAMGNSAIASGENSIAMGNATVASGELSSIAMGRFAKASGDDAIALGALSDASGLSSIAMGFRAEATGGFSVAIGTQVRAYGPGSLAMGFETTAPSEYEIALGYYNTNYNPIGNLNPNDRILSVGNGRINNRSDALILQKNGNLTISGQAYKPGGGGWQATSDIRLKQNIIKYTDGLDKVMAINPVTYNYNELSGHDVNKHYVGVIAQELQNVTPYMVETFTKEGVEYLSIDNSAMTYMLINAIKEQQAIINGQSETINQLTTRLDELEQIIYTLTMSKEKEL